MIYAAYAACARAAVPVFRQRDLICATPVASAMTRAAHALRRQRAQRASGDTATLEARCLNVRDMRAIRAMSAKYDG